MHCSRICPTWQHHAASHGRTTLQQPCVMPEWMFAPASSFAAASEWVEQAGGCWCHHSASHIHVTALVHPLHDTTYCTVQPHPTPIAFCPADCAGHHPRWRRRHPPVPVDQEACQAGGAPGCQLPPDRHPRQQLRQQQRHQDLLPDPVQLRLPQQAPVAGIRECRGRGLGGQQCRQRWWLREVPSREAELDQRQLQ
jgi:hypothetical protein